VKVFVDMKSHELLAGATIDFVVALEELVSPSKTQMQRRAALRQVVRLTSYAPVV